MKIIINKIDNLHDNCETRLKQIEDDFNQVFETNININTSKSFENEALSKTRKLKSG